MNRYGEDTGVKLLKAQPTRYWWVEFRCGVERIASFVVQYSGSYELVQNMVQQKPAWLVHAMKIRGKELYGSGASEPYEAISLKEWHS